MKNNLFGYFTSAPLLKAPVTDYNPKLIKASWIPTTTK